MDFNLKQWRRHESDQEPETTPSSSKLQRLDPHRTSSSPSSALPLFLSQPAATLSEYNHGSTIRTKDVNNTMAGINFSSGRWQELELQALIFRHMISVPPHLLHLLHNTSPCYPLHHYCHHHPAAPLGYWGKGSMDPEPRRCRRTDGKKWRCSRDVAAAGQKYCERHVHRGKNRSRKPVEIVVPTDQFTLSGASVVLLRLDPRRLNSIDATKREFEAPNDGGGDKTLRRFFDDWPGSLHESDNAASSATSLSISMPGNPLSDFSLKLGTGSGDERGASVASDGPSSAELGCGVGSKSGGSDGRTLGRGTEMIDVGFFVPYGCGTSSAMRSAPPRRLLAMCLLC